MTQYEQITFDCEQMKFDAMIKIARNKLSLYKQLIDYDSVNEHNEHNDKIFITFRDTYLNDWINAFEKMFNCAIDVCETNDAYDLIYAIEKCDTFAKFHNACDVHIYHA